MAAQSYLGILDRLALGQISPDRAVQLIERQKEQEKVKAQRLHRRFFSCVTIRVRPEGRFGLYFKVPIGLMNICLALAGLSPRLRRKIHKHGVSLREIHAMIRYLKYREAGFDIRVEAKDGTKVLVHN